MLVVRCYNSEHRGRADGLIGGRGGGGSGEGRAGARQGRLNNAGAAGRARPAMRQGIAGRIGAREERVAGPRSVQVARSFGMVWSVAEATWPSCVYSATHVTDLAKGGLTGGGHEGHAGGGEGGEDDGTELHGTELRGPSAAHQREARGRMTDGRPNGRVKNNKSCPEGRREQRTEQRRVRNEATENTDEGARVGGGRCEKAAVGYRNS